MFMRFIFLEIWKLTYNNNVQFKQLGNKQFCINKQFPIYSRCMIVVK